MIKKDPLPFFLQGLRGEHSVFRNPIVAPSNRTFWDDGSVVYLHIHCGSHYSKVAFEHLKCGKCKLGTEFFILFNLNEFMLKFKFQLIYI